MTIEWADKSLPCVRFCLPIVVSHEGTRGCAFSAYREVCNRGKLFVFTSRDISNLEWWFGEGFLGFWFWFWFSSSPPCIKKSTVQAFNLKLGGSYELFFSTERTCPEFDIFYFSICYTMLLQGLWQMFSHFDPVYWFHINRAYLRPEGRGHVAN